MASTPHIAVIGAGPAGLMAAETLARGGASVTIYDRMPSPARKFLIAGRGGLNLTHSEPLDDFIPRYGSAAEWLAPMIRAFTPADLREWCEGLGVETFVGSSGRVFPKNMKAVALLRNWLKRLDAMGVRYMPRHNWLGWQDGKLRFENAEKETLLVKADATLLSLGGASWPKLGSDGAWTKLMPDVTVTPLEPSNCGFVASWSEHFAQRFAGAPLKPVAVTHQKQTRQGEAMITAQGIEGGVIYALSSAIRDVINANGKADITLDLRPNMTQDTLTQKLQSQKRASKSLSTYLKGLGFSPLAVGLLRETASTDTLAAMDAKTLASRIKAIPVTLTSTSGITRAISSAGGIARSELNDDLMLKAMPGVFAAGEMLDWEAPTGGYLLQACFSTAIHAAKGILRYRKSA